VTHIEKKPRANRDIRAKEVRLIDESGAQLGVFPLSEALAIAKGRNLDLVEVAAHVTPPVCRLLNYGKYIYERTKREKEARKAQKQLEVKEIRLRPKTQAHDLAIKAKRARGFLSEGFKVKIRVLFRGREIAHGEIAAKLLEELAKELEDQAIVEQRPQMDGRSLLMVLSPGGGK
jgi:translation initiation factor IF-3